MAQTHEPGNLERTTANLELWASSSVRMVAGFWEKAGALALPRDTHGEGYRALLKTRRIEIAYCTLFVFASSLGQTFLLSLFSPHWSAALDLSPAAMGSLYCGATLAGGLLLPMTGNWLDRAPSGRAGLAAYGGLFAGCLLAASVSSVWTLALALFVLRFSGQGVSVNVGITRVTRWFEHNRGKALSLTVLGFPLGEAVLPITVTVLIGALGWRGAWLALAAVCVLVVAPSASVLLAKRRAKYGLAQAPETSPPSSWAERMAVLRDWRFYAMLVVTVPVPFAGTGIIFFQSTIAETRGWGPAIVPTGFVVFALVRALFSLSAGAWVDRIGSLRLLAAPTTLFAAGVACLTFDSPLFAYAFFALLGVGFGAASGVMTTAWADLFGAERIGQVRGLSGVVGVGATAIAPMVFGWALEIGIPINTLLWGNVLFIAGCTWPMCVVLARRGQHAPRAARA